MIPLAQLGELFVNYLLLLIDRFLEVVLQRHLPAVIAGQVVDPRADEPHRPLLDLPQQIPRLLPYGRGRITRHHDPRSRYILHVGVRHFKRHTPAVETLSFCPPLNTHREQEKYVVEESKIADVLLKGQLAAYRFGVQRVVRYDFAVIDAVGHPRDVRSVLAEQPDDLILPVPDVAHRCDADALEFFRRPRAHGVQRSDIPVYDQIHELLRRADLKIPVRLLLLARGLRRSLGIRDADRAREMHLFARPPLDRLSDLPRAGPVTGGLRYVQISLIQSDRLGSRRIVIPDAMQLIRDRPVFIKIRMHVDALRAQPVRFLDIHPGMHTVLPRLIACRRNNAALLRKRPDD